MKKCRLPPHNTTSNNMLTTLCQQKKRLLDEKTFYKTKNNMQSPQSHPSKQQATEQPLSLPLYESNKIKQTSSPNTNTDAVAQDILKEYTTFIQSAVSDIQTMHTDPSMLMHALYNGCLTCFLHCCNRKSKKKQIIWILHGVV